MEQIKEAAEQKKPGGARLKKSNRKKPMLIAGGILAAAAAAYVGLCAYAGSLDTFYSNYRINGVEVGGLTASEAQEKLEAELPGQVVTIRKTAEETLTVTLADLGFSPQTVDSSCTVPYADWAQTLIYLCEMTFTIALTVGSVKGAQSLTSKALGL